jgi:hypothetical protein
VAANWVAIMQRDLCFCGSDTLQIYKRLPINRSAIFIYLFSFTTIFYLAQNNSTAFYPSLKITNSFTPAVCAIAPPCTNQDSFIIPQTKNYIIPPKKKQPS